MDSAWRALLIMPVCILPNRFSSLLPVQCVLDFEGRTPALFLSKCIFVLVLQVRRKPHIPMPQQALTADTSKTSHLYKKKIIIINKKKYFSLTKQTMNSNPEILFPTETHRAQYVGHKLKLRGSKKICL